MRRLAFAAPPLLLRAAPWCRRPCHLCGGGRCQRGEGSVRGRGRALKWWREPWRSFVVGLIFCFSLHSAPLGTRPRPDHGPQFRVVHCYHDWGGRRRRWGGWGRLPDLDELLSREFQQQTLNASVADSCFRLWERIRQMTMNLRHKIRKSTWYSQAQRNIFTFLHKTCVLFVLKAKTHIVEFICDGKGIRWKRKTQIREISQQPVLQFGVWWFFRFFLRQERCRRTRAVTPDCGTLCAASAIWPRGDNTGLHLTRFSTSDCFCVSVVCIKSHTVKQPYS